MLRCALNGPLYANLQANGVTWRMFFNTYSPSPVAFWGDSDPSPEQKAAWRLWMTTVFTPMNASMVEAFTKQADLLEETEMPECLLVLVAHVAAYQAVIKSWQDGDFSDVKSLVAFPRVALESYVVGSFLRLKQRQAQLLGESRRLLG